jgi:enoyl-CoA hydratase/carnithine racemase
MPPLLYEVKDRIAYVTLNRPDQRNAIDYEMKELFFDTLGEVKSNPDIWICIINGNGRDFCTGHDLKDKPDEIGTGRSTEDTYLFVQEMWKPTVSAINGYCLAQGAGIALSCDIRIAADDAQIGWPHVKRGLASTSGPALLCDRVPINIALQALYTGDFLSAQEALNLKLVNMVVPADKLMEEADKFVRTKILPNAPLAMRAIKEAATRGRELNLRQRVRFCGFFVDKMRRTNDAVEGVNAFKEKREPRFTGT